jgi:hypothetical protein
LSLADGLGVTPQKTRDVLDPAVTQLRGLDGRVPATILLTQRVVQPLHHSLDPRCMEADLTRAKNVIAEITAENLELKKGLSG